MTGEIAGSNQRLTSRDDSAARQGATIAFASHPPPPPRTPNAKPLTSAAVAAALASTATRCHAEPRSMDPAPESGPEVGSVRDKIGRLNANSATPADAVGRDKKSVPSLSPVPGQIAARPVASPSPDRKPAPASDAAKLGAIRSAARVQSQAPVDGRTLRSPTPIRPNNTENPPLESLLRDDLTSSDRDSGIGHSPVQRSRASSLRDQALGPHPSVSSQTSLTHPHETKPKLPPRSTGPSVGSGRKPVSSGNPLRAATPSMASTSGHPQNSNSSAVEDSGGMSEESLSNAIVASSLASARASPTTVVPPPPPTRRRGRARSILHLTHSPTSDASRTPSPPKGMPHTLRGMPKVDDTDPHRRHRLLHKHPHKHHEGDRKKWRQEVTEKERRRYEGIWASNKGLFIPPERGNMRGPMRGEKWPPASECVLNLVVRDVWSRSRLPPTALEQVWELVDHRQIGLLTKEEFVVGMWLIDQQLKGHKLPVKVPESVWDSVRYVTGIKLTTVSRG